MQANDNSQQNISPFDPETQKRLNEPLKDPTGVDPKDQEFLQSIVSLIEEGKINLYRPSSLLNGEAYDKLSNELKAKADLESMNLLNSVRDIKNLYENGFRDSFQIQYAVNEARMEKERVEQVCGDVFII